MAEDKYADTLFKDYLTGVISKEDIEHFFHLVECLSDEELRERLSEIPDAGFTDRMIFDDRRKDVVKYQIFSQINNDSPAIAADRRSIRRTMVWLSIAASLILFGAYLSISFQMLKGRTDFKASHPVDKVRREQTSITIGNTRYSVNANLCNLQILDDKLVVRSVGKIIPFSTTDEIHISTSAQSVCDLVLADKSVITMNAGTSIWIPGMYSRSERRVRMNGEAFFEVSKSNMPFRVVLANAVVNVLGTGFNVNNYGDAGDTRVTLVHGSIKYGTSIAQRIIKPGEQIRNNGIGNLKTIAVSVDTVTAWKEGVFNFNGKTINQALKEVCNWYNIELHIMSGVSAHMLTGKMSRTSSINTFIDYINKTYPVNLNLRGAVLTVSPQVDFKH